MVLPRFLRGSGRPNSEPDDGRDGAGRELAEYIGRVVELGDLTLTGTNGTDGVSGLVQIWSNANGAETNGNGHSAEPPARSSQA